MTVCHKQSESARASSMKRCNFHTPNSTENRHFPPRSCRAMLLRVLFQPTACRVCVRACLACPSKTPHLHASPPPPRSQVSCYDRTVLLPYVVAIRSLPPSMQGNCFWKIHSNHQRAHTHCQVGRQQRKRASRNAPPSIGKICTFCCSSGKFRRKRKVLKHE